MNAGLTHFLLGSEIKREEKAACITRTDCWLLLRYRFHLDIGTFKSSIVCVCVFYFVFVNPTNLSVTSAANECRAHTFSL